MKELTTYNKGAGYLNKIFDLLNEAVRIACLDCGEPMIEV